MPPRSHHRQIDQVPTSSRSSCDCVDCETVNRMSVVCRERMRRSFRVLEVRNTRLARKSVLGPPAEALKRVFAGCKKVGERGPNYLNKRCVIRSLTLTKRLLLASC